MGTNLPAPSITPDEVIEAIRTLAKKLGRVPRRKQFFELSGIGEYQLYRAFPTWGSAVKAAGFPSYHKLKPHALEDLLADWGQVVRKLGRLPVRKEYNKLAEFSLRMLLDNYASWDLVPKVFLGYARSKPEWGDVVPIVESSTPEHDRTHSDHSAQSDRATDTLLQSQADFIQWRQAWRASLKERPRSAYAELGFGDPLDFRRLRNAPVNESGVILLFGMIAADLGLMIEAVQPGFPDCEAKYQTDDGKWRRLRIEFEYESRNFLSHGHKADDCDVIVCWKHNWKECPLQVIELSTAVKELKAA